MSAYVPPIGAPKSEIDTPALLINHEVLERNIHKMAGYFKGTNIRLRPHSKTHKNVQIAKKQIAAGAVGITCAKLGEAEALADGGIEDILIANQIIGPIKIARLAQLAKRIRIAVAVDDPQNIQMLSDAAVAEGVTIGCLVEVDNGMHRCGVQPGEPALALARQNAQSKGLALGGIQSYEGHLPNLMPLEEREVKTKAAMQLAVDSKKLIESHGIPAPVISGGSTGTFRYSMQVPGVNEIQAGSYVTMDATYRSKGADFESALTLLATVISRPNEGLAVIDAGMKAITQEFGWPTPLVEGATIKGLSEEHGSMIVTGAARELKAGDKIEIVPSHGCTTINLHDNFYVMEDDRLMDIWKITGRGKFQ
jgi:D-serine deaminase-like pyridoxal phosphate-dependent protein